MLAWSVFFYHGVGEVADSDADRDREPCGTVGSLTHRQGRILGIGRGEDRSQVF